MYELGIKIFGDEVFHKETLDRIQRLIMQIIKAERDGEAPADRFLLKNLTQMMLEISKKDIYIPHFEQRFLQESRDYFTKEAAEFFDKSTATQYLEKVLDRLKSERERSIRCLDEGTTPKIEEVIKSTMIDAYKIRLIEVKKSSFTLTHK